MAIRGVRSASPLTEPRGPIEQSGRLRANEWQLATIERIVQETPTVKSFVLRPNRWRPLLPGQHLDVRLTASDGYQARRSYSVTSPPEAIGLLELAVERLHGGEVSSFLHEVAEVGDTIEISDAHAEHFVWRSAAPSGVLLIGGGSGVAPLVAMVRHRAHVPNAGQMTLLYSARSWANVIYRDELLALERDQVGLRVTLCLTRDVQHRPADFARRVDVAILADVLSSFSTAPSNTYLCGSNAFVRSVADMLLALGLAASSIHTERFGGT